MYNQRPTGTYKLNVCTNLPCQLRDGYKALHHLESRLGIKMGETTPDGMFTLQQSECLGACADSPVMLVNDRCMCSFMSNEKLDELDRKSTRLNSSHLVISYAVFCLKKKT